MRIEKFKLIILAIFSLFFCLHCVYPEIYFLASIQNDDLYYDDLSVHPLPASINSLNLEPKTLMQALLTSTHDTLRVACPDMIIWNRFSLLPSYSVFDFLKMAQGCRHVQNLHGVFYRLEPATLASFIIYFFNSFCCFEQGICTSCL